jgi:L-ascorbate metabolism protein UlaG (beta-lactamase superfamily)
MEEDRRNIGQLLKWMCSRKRKRWQHLQTVSNRPEVDRVGPETLAVYWVGHSTLLIQVNGYNILTDPIWSNRCGPWGRIGPKRIAAPGIPISELPPVDLILLSHDHYDHCDMPTLSALAKHHQPHVLTPLGMKKLLLKAGLQKISEFTWWEKIDLMGFTITAVPARHWSGRVGYDAMSRLWCGWVVQAPPTGNILYAGDTGSWPVAWQAIKERFNKMLLAALPIGAYSPRWFMKPNHIDPSEAVKFFDLIDAQYGIGIHHSTFQLSDEARDEPKLLLKKALQDTQIEPERFRTLNHGEGWVIKKGRSGR